MADRVLRGSRLGAVSYETDRDHDLAPRRVARYRTDNGEEFDVPFADDAEIPGTWLCRNGLEGILIEGSAPEAKKVKPPRTHWDMLLQASVQGGTAGTARRATHPAASPPRSAGVLTLSDPGSTARVAGAFAGRPGRAGTGLEAPTR